MSCHSLVVSNTAPQQFCQAWGGATSLLLAGFERCFAFACRSLTHPTRSGLCITRLACQSRRLPNAQPLPSPSATSIHRLLLVVVGFAVMVCIHNMSHTHSPTLTHTHPSPAHPILAGQQDQPDLDVMDDDWELQQAIAMSLNDHHGSDETPAQPLLQLAAQRSQHHHTLPIKHEHPRTQSHQHLAHTGKSCSRPCLFGRAERVSSGLTSGRFLVGFSCMFRGPWLGVVQQCRDRRRSVLYLENPAGLLMITSLNTSAAHCWW